MVRFERALLLAVLSVAVTPTVSSAAVFGALSNFDVVNDTGTTAHGFEIELEGLSSSSITDTFGGAGRGFPTTVERYGAPSISDYSNGSIFGVRVTYQALFSGGAWNVGTPSGTFITPGDNCWSGGGVGYGPSTPCDHFGVGTLGNPTKTTYSWLLETPTPGVLAKGAVNIPAPIWNVVNPVQPGAQPVVIAQIQAPPPPEPIDNEPQFGTAIWAKVFTTEFDNPVGLEELVGNNNKIEQAKNNTEIEWQLLQTDPGNPDAGKLENGGAAPVGENMQTIIRRYEFYEFTGIYKDVDHQALPVNGDSLPGDTEIGHYLGAQNAGINLNGPVPAVPEAETYVLMMAGLGLIGFFSRRRKVARIS